VGKPFFVYILRCSDGSYYVGQTDDLEVRIAQHHEGSFAGYTARRRPVTLVWVAEFATRDEAVAAEAQIKGWRREKKEALIRADYERLPSLAKGYFGLGPRCE
jgi:predicted GIY-YIG superfamily endonuclease